MAENETMGSDPYVDIAECDVGDKGEGSGIMLRPRDGDCSNMEVMEPGGIVEQDNSLSSDGP
jgi:hypothetical protein